MTIICVKDGIVAADSRGTSKYGNLWDGDQTKLWSKPGFGVLAYTGDTAYQEVLFDWVRTGATPSLMPEITLLEESGWGVLHVSPVGKLMLWGMCRHAREVPRPFAMGGAREIAYGAMDAGADAIKAVMICCKRNVFCATPVLAFNFNGERVA